ncbi:hypothetical protein YH65_11075 [Sulfurovum lithotrophicum]|uniref:Uncharacterized protein n=1 Tax=Sulfurovum lithotrophicum TaxID=206403 RepID=A0A7U4M2W0_9BACT|nr:hypothetical protein [Sulfurovum lithotrophicum]AKF25863.1 hypothetical protein YH65_11075 [Sulfurovum lithotrophicum]
MKLKKATIAKLLGNTTKTVENWEKEGRLIITMLHNYFEEEDITEFLNSGTIDKLEKLKVQETEVDIDTINTAYFKIKTTGKKDPESLISEIKQMKDKHNIRKALPVASLMYAAKAAKTNRTKLIDEVDKLEIRESWKNIIKEFITEELTTAEVNQIVLNQNIIMERLRRITKSLTWW